jgi:hypothetical protein
MCLYGVFETGSTDEGSLVSFPQVSSLGSVPCLRVYDAVQYYGYCDFLCVIMRLWRVGRAGDGAEAALQNFRAYVRRGADSARMLLEARPSRKQLVSCTCKVQSRGFSDDVSSERELR